MCNECNSIKNKFSVFWDLITALEISGVVTGGKTSWSAELPINSPIIHTATLREYLLNKTYTAYQQQSEDDVFGEYRQQLQEQSLGLLPPSPSPRLRSSAAIRNVFEPDGGGGGGGGGGQATNPKLRHQNSALFAHYSDEEVPAAVLAMAAKVPTMDEGGMALSTAMLSTEKSVNNHQEDDTFQSRSIVIDTNTVSEDMMDHQNSQLSYDSPVVPVGSSGSFPGEAMPAFDFGMPRNITARTGHTEAIIKCRVDKLDDKSVSL